MILDLVYLMSNIGYSSFKLVRIGENLTHLTGKGNVIIETVRRRATKRYDVPGW